MKRALSLLVVFSSFLLSIPAFSLDDIVVLQGKVLDEKTEQPVDAKVDVYYNSDFTKEFSGSTEDGKYSWTLNKYGWYIISLSAPGYFAETDTLWVVNDNRKNIQRDYHLAPVEVGRTITLKQIYFDFGKTSLSAQSYPQLERIAEFFVENPGLRVEIAGHTDNDGSDEYNLALSQGRAQAVVDHLVQEGVERSRLEARGYGESKPIDTNQTKEGKANNRRVEFTILDLRWSRAR